MANCLLSTVYWGPVQYFSKLISYDNIFIEQYETYPKQSYRNRCELYGSNCVQSLQVPVLKGQEHNPKTKDIRISYQTAWQKNHFYTIQSLYKSSPFFDYYVDDLYKFYSSKYDFLLDYNNDILQVCLKWLKISPNILLTSDYEKQPNCDDFRTIIHPKESHRVEDMHFFAEPYLQVFEDRAGFIPNLSIIDLVMNCGPEAKTILTKSVV